MKEIVKQNDVIVLIDSNLKKIIIDTSSKTDKIKGVGVYNPSNLISIEYGKQIEIGNKQFWLLRPSLQDKLQALKRKAQIILPRDISHILMNCSIQSGQTVFESGRVG